MFRECIRRTEFSSDISNSLFSRIVGSPYREDVSFVSTLRALLPPRMGEKDSCLFSVSSTRASLVDVDPRTLLENVLSGICFGMDYCFSIVNICGNKSNAEADLETLEAHFLETYGDSGWARAERITALYAKAFKVVCFTNSNIKSTILFVENLDLRKFHYLQCCIPGALPWFFSGSKVNEEEFALIDSLRKHDSEVYMESIGRLASHYDFRSESIKSLLNGFEKKFERIQKRELEDEIRSIEGYINDRMTEIRDLALDKERKSIQLLGYNAKIDSPGEGSEIQDYFLANKSLYLMSVGERDFTFVVKTKLAFYDGEAVKTYIGNKNSLIYQNTARAIESKDMANLMKAIFIDETLSVSVCAAYRMDLYGSFSPIERYFYDSSNTEFSNCIPNPHVENYGCMGDYVRIINEMLGRRDFVLAIEQCVASTQSLNWFDHTVISSFMRSMYEDTYECIVLPDGKIVKPSEAIQYLKKKDNEEAENE